MNTRMWKGKARKTITCVLLTLLAIGCRTTPIPMPAAVASATSSLSTPRPSPTLDLAPGVSTIIDCSQVNPLNSRCLGKILPGTPPPIEVIHRFLHAARASDFETAQVFWVEAPPGGWTSPDQREMEIRRAMTAADWNSWGMRDVTQWVDVSREPPYPIGETLPEEANAAIVRMIPVRSDQSGGYEWTVLKIENGWRLWRLTELSGRDYE